MIKDKIYSCDLCKQERDTDRLFPYAIVNGELKIATLPIAISKRHICMDCLNKIMEFMGDCAGQFVDAIFKDQGIDFDNKGG